MAMNVDVGVVGCISKTLTERSELQDDGIAFLCGCDGALVVQLRTPDRQTSTLSGAYGVDGAWAIREGGRLRITNLGMTTFSHPVGRFGVGDRRRCHQLRMIGTIHSFAHPRPEETESAIFGGGRLGLNAWGRAFLSRGGCSATHLEERSSIAVCKSTDVAREAA